MDKSLPGRGGHQFGSVFADHYRVHDQRKRESPCRFGNHFDNFRRSQSARLGCLGRDILDYGFELTTHQVRSKRLHRAYTLRILNRNQGNHAHPVNAELVESLEIRLDAGPA